MFKLDIDDNCTYCGLCVTDCPASVLAMEAGQKPVAAAAESCFNCQHCMAICPVEALAINEAEPGDSEPITSDSLPSAEEMSLLVRGRRSMRQYEDKPVRSELITQLIETAAHAPTGCNHQGLSFHVISSAERMKAFIAESMGALAELAKQDKIPESFAHFKGMAEQWVATGTDTIFRGAPHLLVVSSEAAAPCGQEDAVIALSYFELLAQSHQLGTTWCGLAKVLLELLPQFKQTLQLDGEVGYYYPMLFGWPAVHYHRTVQRNTAARIVDIG
jgi:nitroreductase/NAD-dependent dihydropyrimidine dehydrogenase PreA subunit